jgi:hypothetical protein
MTGTRLAAGPLESVSAARLRATVEKLAAARYAGRRVASVGGVAARTYLAERLVEIGAIDVRVDPFAVAAGEAGNLYARLHSTGHCDTDVLLTAHFDGVGDLPDRRRPGASHNASGVVLVMEAARLLMGAMPLHVDALTCSSERGAAGRRGGRGAGFGPARRPAHRRR